MFIGGRVAEEDGHLLSKCFEAARCLHRQQPPDARTPCATFAPGQLACGHFPCLLGYQASYCVYVWLAEAEGCVSMAALHAHAQRAHAVHQHDAPQHAQASSAFSFCPSLSSSAAVFPLFLCAETQAMHEVDVLPLACHALPFCAAERFCRALLRLHVTEAPKLRHLPRGGSLSPCAAHAC